MEIKDRYDLIYFNGSSFTENAFDEFNERYLNYEDCIKLDENYYTGQIVTYPVIIKKITGVDIINEAKQGAGLPRLIRKTWEFIDKNELEVLKKTLFILEISTSINRLDVYSNEQKDWMVVNVEYDDDFKAYETNNTFNWIYGPQLRNSYNKKVKNIIVNYVNEFLNVDVYDKVNSNNLLGLISFFKLNEIDFFLSGQLTYDNKHLKNFENNFLKLNIKNELYSDIYFFSEKNGLRICDEIKINDNHPNFDAHKIWGESIVEFINNKL